MRTWRQLGWITGLLLGLSLPCGAAVQAEAGPQVIKLPDARLVVNGLPWFTEDQPALRRLPARLQETFRAPVWALAQQPSGGRIRFRTDSTTLRLHAANPEPGSMPHLPSVAQNGVDLYVDGEFRAVAWPDGKGRINRRWTLGHDQARREVTLYLPLYNGVTIESLELDAGAALSPPGLFARGKPVVFYGSSITQGGCASNAGMSYPAIVCRRLNLDFVNLGFSGEGKGEPAVARAIAEIDAACYVLDYWANVSAAQFRETLPSFVAILRKHRPRVPILVLSAYYNTAEALGGERAAWQDEKRAIALAFVAERRIAGDRWIHYVDGRDLLNRSQAAGLVDGRHSNTLGFWFCANGLEPHLRAALGLRAAPATRNWTTRHGHRQRPR